MNPAMSILLNNVFQIVGSVLLLAAVPLVHYLVKLFSAKTGLDISQAKQDQLDGVVTNAVNHAEEWANGQVKAKAGASPSGAQKMQQAITFVEEELNRLGWTQMAKDKIQKFIEAKLAVTRSNATP